jgi:hypothetical protein
MAERRPHIYTPVERTRLEAGFGGSHTCPDDVHVIGVHRRPALCLADFFNRTLKDLK